MHYQPLSAIGATPEGLPNLKPIHFSRILFV
jgi:hypothetical protein